MSDSAIDTLAAVDSAASRPDKPPGEHDAYRRTVVDADVVAAMITPIASVVIPAHNEEAVLARCLRTLLDGANNDELDVIVVANACRDDTVKIARTFGARVIETSHLGKPNALRLGDSECKVFPRIYLDADTELSGADLRIMIACLASSPAIACAPRPELDPTGVGRVVRRAHRVHDCLVAPTRGLSGPTVYMLSQAAHDRVFPIPDVISDDGWVHRNLTSSEWIVVNEARCVLRPARTLAAAARRRARVRLGNRQLDAIGVPLQQNRLGPWELVTLVRSSQVTPVDAACFLVMLAGDHAVTALRRLLRTNTLWSADRTSRAPSPGHRALCLIGSTPKMRESKAQSTAQIQRQARKRDEMQTGTNHSLETYVMDLAGRRANGMQRGTTAALVRKVTTVGMRDSAKVWGTRVFAPRSRRQACSLANGRTDLRLHLGSGTNRLDGWINIDILGMRPDLLWDLRDGIPFPDGCAHAVFLEHVLEHFGLTHVIGVLRECRRVMAPRGLIRVGVPDFGKYLESYCGDRAFIESERPSRPTPLLALAEVALFHGHRSVWDAETLTLALVEAGFDDVQVCAHGESTLRCAPDAEHRRSESVYAEGRTPE